MPALRALEAAENYLREGHVYNSYAEGWIAHTRGIAYHGCGWWEEAETNLLKAIQVAKHLRQWSEWAGAAGDFVSLALGQAEAEGPDPALLEQALQQLDSVRQQFELANNESLTLQTKIHTLKIKSILATLRRDRAALRQIQNGFTEIIQEYGGPHSFLNQPGNFGSLLQWTVGECRHVRAMADLKAVNYAEVEDSLEAQQRLLERALYKQPRMAILWQEKAILHLCRARHGLDYPTAALLAATDCMENAVDILRSLTRNYDDPQVRAGWLGKANDLLEGLAEIAAFALTSVRPASPDVAARMVRLAQYLRARSQQDFARNLAGVQPTSERNETEALLTRIRSLHRWLERLDLKGQKERVSSTRTLAEMGVEKEGNPTSLLNEATAEIFQQYPEYALFASRGQVEDELQGRKREFAQRVSGNALLRAQAVQIESEAPFDLSALQASLSDGDIVLDYYAGPAALHVGVISRQDLLVLRLPVDNMREFREIAKRRLFPNPSAEGSLRASMRQYSDWLLPAELVDLLIKLAGQRLYVVASGPLWKVPFPWLDAMGQLVLERWETCIIPSASLAGAGQFRPSPFRTFAIGHPGPPKRHLGNAGPEVSEVAKLMKGMVLFKTEATPQRVLFDVLPQADVIHFACHGECDPVSPLASCLALEPDDQHPDGRLMLYEVLGVPLRAKVVSLGACHTARSEGPTTFPESLAHAFLGAGAQFVIASLWAADDDQSLHFSNNFYTMLKQGASPAVAFRRAQLRQANYLRANGRRDYVSFADEDFARMANFVLLSARKTGVPAQADGN